MKIFALFIVVTSVFVMNTEMAFGKDVERDRLVKALIVVESGGNDRAHGDKHLKEQAYGCLQIRQPCVDDVNRRHGTKYRAEDCLGNRELSIWIFSRYMDIYATKARIGRQPTDQDRARIWNGGPSGWKRSSTIPYWNKVRRAMK